MARLGSGIPLVARGAQLRQLRAALRQAGKGTAGAVLLAGDAGVGKSRLLTELSGLAAGEGALVLTGRCLDVGEGGLPYLPFVEALGQLRESHLDALRAHPALAKLLPEVLPEHVSTGEARRSDLDMSQLQMFDAVHVLLTELAAERTVLLALEDLHWADGSTRHLVSFLLSRLRGHRLLVVATYRSDDLHRRHPLRPLLAELVRLPAVERLDLAPFTTADARTFVRRLGDGLPERRVAQIAERSEGNAFFAEELIAACADTGDGVPIGLADVLLARIERLAPTTQQVIRVASVSGRRVTDARLGAVTGLPDHEIEAALREAVTHHVLVYKDTSHAYVFRHALLREAVYADLLPGERVRLHAGYAKFLAAKQNKRGLAAELAHHSMRCHDLRQALAASVAAAREAADARAPADGLRHLEAALKLWNAVPDPEEVTGGDELYLVHKAMHTASSAGEDDRALAYGRTAVTMAEALGDPVRAAEVQRKYVQTLMAVEGKRDKAQQVIERAWQLVADQPPSPTRAWVLAVRARVTMNVDRQGTGLALEYVRAARADAEACGAIGAQVDAEVSLGILASRLGDQEQAAEHYRVALRRTQDADIPSVELRAWYNLAVNRYEAGEVGEALDTARRGWARAEATGLSWSTYGVELRALHILLLYVHGDWDSARKAADLSGCAVPDAASARIAAVSLFTLVGRGEFARLPEMAQRVRPDWHKDWDIAIIAAACFGDAELWRGDLDRALDWIVEALDIAYEHRELAVVRIGTLKLAVHAEFAANARQHKDTATETEHTAEAAEVLAGIHEVLANLPETKVLGPEARAWLARAEAEEARTRAADTSAHWRKVVDGFAYGHRYEQALARYRLVRTLTAEGDKQAAARELHEATAAATALGAAPLAEALATLARRARLATPAGEHPELGVDPFTPRERAVLDLVAKGHTNRQVGEQLFISEKTVSVHLSRVMAKLGAASRTEAVTKAHERALL
ncbi:DNA-binding CsgD family transcriptional regulator [Crossiella equi]|uniref:DNA-binding CsgD family transcriptional regulator n=1 Tax=Crossiella equi TaxID=130796 RepID=A0ABS5AQD7_9PSEU|nr:DNA-binding CsgD family transcriptional regulator [Crossiella equi]